MLKPILVLVLIFILSISHIGYSGLDELDDLNHKIDRMNRGVFYSDEYSGCQFQLITEGLQMVGGVSRKILFDKPASPQELDIARSFYINSSIHYNMLLATRDRKISEDERYVNHMSFGYLIILGVKCLLEKLQFSYCTTAIDNYAIYRDVREKIKSYHYNIIINDDRKDSLYNRLYKKFISCDADTFNKVLGDNFILEVLKRINIKNGYKSIVHVHGNKVVNSMQCYIELYEALCKPKHLNMSFTSVLQYSDIKNVNQDQLSYIKSCSYLAYKTIFEFIFLTKEQLDQLSIKYPTISKKFSKVDTDTLTKIRDSLHKKHSDNHVISIPHEVPPYHHFLKKDLKDLFDIPFFSMNKPTQLNNKRESACEFILALKEIDGCDQSFENEIEIQKYIERKRIRKLVSELVKTETNESYNRIYEILNSKRSSDEQKKVEIEEFAEKYCQFSTRWKEKLKAERKEKEEKKLKAIEDVKKFLALYNSFKKLFDLPDSASKLISDLYKDKEKYLTPVVEFVGILMNLAVSEENLHERQMINNILKMTTISDSQKRTLLQAVVDNYNNSILMK